MSKTLIAVAMALGSITAAHADSTMQWGEGSYPNDSMQSQPSTLTRAAVIAASAACDFGTGGGALGETLGGVLAGALGDGLGEAPEDEGVDDSVDDEADEHFAAVMMSV